MLVMWNVFCTLDHVSTTVATLKCYYTDNMVECEMLNEDYMRLFMSGSALQHIHVKKKVDKHRNTMLLFRSGSGYGIVFLLFIIPGLTYAVLQVHIGPLSQ